MAFRDEWIKFIHGLQSDICSGLEKVDGKSSFILDEWVREGGGGGKTRVISDGTIFEKGGVNTSVVYGEVTDPMRAQLKISGEQWFACGLSLVIHPLNPFVPTTHANWRYFETYDAAGEVLGCWFGGGADLTPYYLFEEDARHFHGCLRDAMSPFGADLYPFFKKECDSYFVNKHRGDEMRGIGGVFYDHLRPSGSELGSGARSGSGAGLGSDAGLGSGAGLGSLERLFAFQQAQGNAFLGAYVPIVERRKDIAFEERHVEWQEIRRGRYVEFNLIHDRGTIFGLKTNGRTESILMSLPPRARWGYNYQPLPGSPEAELLDACLHPRDWLG